MVSLYVGINICKLTETNDKKDTFEKIMKQKSLQQSSKTTLTISHQFHSKL